METVRLSSKGQIVIPKSIRDDLHLPPGTEFIVSRTATGLSLTPTTHFPRTLPSEVRGVLAKPGRKLPDVSDLKAAIHSRLKAADDATK
ncbi:MAG: hypothetical protein EOP02_16345 [Proteobacteria bacterium]|nr:MAG: hypothetical protein EOP02_16345 [Pseudomonadota bacterium]